MGILIENEILLNEYVSFSTNDGRFHLTSKASEMIYREKNIICSYSGADEWCNHFMCELIDLYSGSSKYNYCIETTIHEDAIPASLKAHNEETINWIKTLPEKKWGKNLLKNFTNILDGLVTNI